MLAPLGREESEQRLESDASFVITSLSVQSGRSQTLKK